MQEMFIAPAAGVLVVDDNELNLRATEALLGKFQIDVKKAYSGHDAIDLVKKENFDIIFLDQMMPGMDGIETAVCIRNWESKFPKGKPLVIVALTAAAVSWEMFYSNGFNGCIYKPVDIKDLVKILTKWLPKEKIQPVETPAVENSDILANKKLYAELVKLFLEDNQNKYDDIIKALEADDIKTAHRFAHSLKSSAGHLGKKQLQYAAADIEKSLVGGKNQVTEQQLNALKVELTAVLEQLTEAS